MMYFVPDLTLSARFGQLESRSKEVDDEGGHSFCFLGWPGLHAGDAIGDFLAIVQEAGKAEFADLDCQTFGL